jgi:hypothetical protein
MDQLRTFTFGKGSHPSREDGMCVMEVCAMLAGEKHSDTPACADPVITKLAIWVNDSCNDQLRNELLLDLPWRIVGTKSTPEIEQQRAFMAADWTVRFVCPTLLRRAGLTAEAEKLEQQPPIINKEAAARAAEAAGAAAEGAKAAGAAAGAARAAEAAARASGAAAWAAARAAEAAARAAEAAAWAAEGAAWAAWAAEAAAWAARAAEAAAWAARAAEAAETARAAAELEAIQRSCVDLIDRMIRLTEPQEVVPACRTKRHCVTA